MVVKSKGHARAAVEEQVSRVMAAALTHPPSYVRSIEQSLCPDPRI